MFSATLSKSAILALRREVKAAHPAIYKVLGRINAWMLKARNNGARDKGAHKRGDSQEKADAFAEAAAPEDLYPHLRDFHRRSEAALTEGKLTAPGEALLEQYFVVHRFLRVAEQYDAAYRSCYRRSGSDLDVRLYCMDPARQLGDALAGCRTGVFFSATLRPEDYYRHLLGLPAKTETLILRSPFPPEHLKVTVDSRISTHYRDRRKTCDAVARRILGATSDGGKHLVFFPSYAYLEMVYTRLNQLVPGHQFRVQTPSMSEAQRADFLDCFRSDCISGCVGLAVMGGIFGEGIDLVGERLTGAVVVGVGLPGICLERDLICDYFKTLGRDGFAYAYTYPGITRVLQAAGRVIRSASDRGKVLLLDRRYGSARYRRLMPPHWRPQWGIADDL
jgi:DNA excision repair protein ERCC-2